MTPREYRGIRYDNPNVQAQFERLLEAVVAAEREREPIAKRHRLIEQDADSGVGSDANFRAVDDAFIAANNKIATAKRVVDAFLQQNRNYQVD